mmetsp:Transcript_7804/g.33159  ORF Transcript_7804/g.33159 Transcript_7804/m.33159 type:complete len:214 (-) Transcript_7804:126-767(-)
MARVRSVADRPHAQSRADGDGGGSFARPGARGRGRVIISICRGRIVHFGRRCGIVRRRVALGRRHICGRAADRRARGRPVGGLVRQARDDRPAVHGRDREEPRGGVRDAHDFGGVPEVLPAGQRAAHRAVRRRQASRVLPALGAGEVRRRRRRQDAAPMADVPRAAHQPGRRRRGRRALPGGRGGGSVRDRRTGERAGRAVKRRTGEARQVAL